MLTIIMEVILRSIFTYIFLLIIGRIIGRKLISRITFYDFIIGVTLGSIAVRIALGSQESPYLAAIAAIVLTILAVSTDYLDIKSISFRKIIDGEPVILISNGEILNYNLKKVRITINKLIMQLREKDIFNLDDVALAVIESDGELTVLKKDKNKSTSSGDCNGLICDIIIDGKIMPDNLKIVKKDENWVIEQLRTYKITDIKEVFYAGMNSDGVLYVSPKKNK